MLQMSFWTLAKLGEAEHVRDDLDDDEEFEDDVEEGRASRRECIPRLIVAMG
jgi:hypothetical protein